MQTSKQSGRRSSSVVGELRRDQIVSAAARVLARDGLSATSLNRVAEEAGLSSAGLITYHFRDKDEIFSTLVESLLDSLAETVRTAVEPAPDATAALAAYLDAFVRFQDEHRDGVRALARLVSGWKPPGASRAFDPHRLVTPVEEILDRGQAAGEFRSMDTAWVARCIQCSAENFHQIVCEQPDIDTDAFVAELQTLYGNAVRRESAS